MLTRCWMSIKFNWGPTIVRHSFPELYIRFWPLEYGLSTSVWATITIIIACDISTLPEYLEWIFMIVILLLPARFLTWAYLPTDIHLLCQPFQINLQIIAIWSTWKSHRTVCPLSHISVTHGQCVTNSGNLTCYRPLGFFILMTSNYPTIHANSSLP